MRDIRSSVDVILSQGRMSDLDHGNRTPSPPPRNGGGREEGRGGEKRKKYILRSVNNPQTRGYFQRPQCKFAQRRQTRRVSGALKKSDCEKSFANRNPCYIYTLHIYIHIYTMDDLQRNHLANTL